jgi:hypothetical protein
VRAARHVQIRTVRYIECSAKIWPDVLSGAAKQIKVSAGFTRPRVEQRDDAVIITTTFRLTLQAENSQAGSPPLARVSAGTELTYAREPGVEIETADLDDFAAVNAPFNAWPFWREFVQSSLTRLGLPPLLLPLFRIEEAPSLVLAEEELT